MVLRLAIPATGHGRQLQVGHGSCRSGRNGARSCGRMLGLAFQTEEVYFAKPIWQVRIGRLLLQRIVAQYCIDKLQACSVRASGCVLVEICVAEIRERLLCCWPYTSGSYGVKHPLLAVLRFCRSRMWNAGYVETWTSLLMVTSSTVGPCRLWDPKRTCRSACDYCRSAPSPGACYVILQIVCSDSICRL